MTIATSIDPSLELQRQELAELIRRHAGEPHGPASAIDDLYLVRYTENVRSVPTLAQPALCILAQGSKSLFLGDEQYAYDPLHYMVVSVTLPLSGVKLDASPEHPSLGLRMDLDPAEISQLIAESGPMLVPSPACMSRNSFTVPDTSPSIRTRRTTTGNGGGVSTSALLCSPGSKLKRPNRKVRS